MVRHAANAINILGVDYQHPSETTRSIKILNNLFYDIDGGKWGNGGGGILVLLNGPGTSELEFSQNTAIHTGSCLQFEDGSNVTGLNVTNNIMRFHILGAGLAGTEALERFAGGHVTVQNNAIVLSEKRDYWITRYPSNNLYPESYDTVGFSNLAGSDYSLRASSSLKRNATGKGEVGVNLAQLAGAGVLQEASLAK